MEWIERLRGEIVGLDTAPIIYWVEENPNYLRLVQPFFEALDRGEFEAVTSTVSLLEVLVYPIRCGNMKLAKQYREILLRAKGLATLQLDEEIAERAAELRANYNVRTPDAIQLATALHLNATYFLTNDAGLPPISELSVLLLREMK